MMVDIDEFAKKSLDFCKEMGWTKDWLKGGCYIHLEASEFIEALRGKGDPLEELGDVLNTVLSVAEYYNLSPSEAILKSKKKMNKILNEKESWMERKGKFFNE